MVYNLVIFSVDQVNKFYMKFLRTMLIAQVIVFLTCMPAILGSFPPQSSHSAVVDLSWFSVVLQDKWRVAALISFTRIRLWFIIYYHKFHERCVV